MNAGQTGVKGYADNIEVVARIGNKLLLGHPAHRLNLVADACGLLKLQPSAGFFHTSNQLRQHLIVFPG